MRMAFDVVVFDLDGTLADTADDLAAALNHALMQIGRPTLALCEVRAMVGHGTRALMRKGLEATGGVSEALVDDALPALTAFYTANICRETTGYPGVEQALDALMASGARLAVCTNKPEALARMLVEALGWGDRFAAVIGGDTLALAKHRFPGMHNSLDALCKRFKVSLSEREKHGALIDAKLLAAVYLELKGGRERRLELTAELVVSTAHISSRNAYGARPRPLPLRSSTAERQSHAAFIRDVVKSDELWGQFGL